MQIHADSHGVLERLTALGGNGGEIRQGLSDLGLEGLIDDVSVRVKWSLPRQEQEIPGSDPLTSSGDPYFTLSLGAGVLYAWTDHIALEFGFNVVNSISDMEGEWSIGPNTEGTYETDLSMTRGYLGVLFGF